MKKVEISVSNWDKFNPRKDLKSMPWFRLQSDIGYSETLFGLCAEAKWLWIFILSTCARKVSPDIRMGYEYMEFHTGIKAKLLKQYLQLFENKGLVRITNESVRITNESVTDPNESVPNEHNEHNEHNEQDERNVRPRSDTARSLKLKSEKSNAGHKTSGPRYPSENWIKENLLTTDDFLIEWAKTGPLKSFEELAENFYPEVLKENLYKSWEWNDERPKSKKRGNAARLLRDFLKWNNVEPQKLYDREAEESQRKINEMKERKRRERELERANQSQ